MDTGTTTQEAATKSQGGERVRPERPSSTRSS